MFSGKDPLQRFSKSPTVFTTLYFKVLSDINIHYKLQEKRRAARSYLSVKKTAANGKKTHGKAQNTTINYDGHIRRGKEFLAAYSRDDQLSEVRGESDSAANTDSDTPMDPEFPYAFTGPPAKCTPFALSTFLAYKCFTENVGVSTASQVHAAFLHYYDNMDGDRFRGRWMQDGVTKEWIGNPARSGEVEDMLSACKNKDGEGERKHSRAITIQDMEALYVYSEKNLVKKEDASGIPLSLSEVGLAASSLFFNALSTTGFTIWTRNCETISLQYGNLEFPDWRNRHQGEFFTVNLRNRKNWQRRVKKNEQQLNGHTYNIYAQPKTPAIDMYVHMLKWLDFYETHLLRRPLRANDYLFPTIGANGTSTHPDRGITSDVARSKIVETAEKAGIRGANEFTTHCFRRGGAQYRFMFAPVEDRWTLARIRWWGGWALGEHRDTLIRYLLDELYTYEQDHSNALCPSHGSESAGGLPHVDENSHRMFSAQAEVALRLENQLSELRQEYTHLASKIDKPRSENVFASSLSTAKLVVCNVGNVGNDNSSHSNNCPPLNQPPKPSHVIPEIGRKLGATAWRQVIKDWEETDPSRCHDVALKDWDPEWHRSNGESVKYGQRQMIAIEFIERYNRDEEAFEKAYPEHQRGVMPLLIAIRAEQQRQGLCHRRRGKKRAEDD
ncbi:hypothetical protein BYT27DRAFT_7226962 [Phlegmacium glaucopus]|nr:hypothetical protein BYT27DRAFT_7226962 [Phlegmacium glaucopus]